MVRLRHPPLADQSWLRPMAHILALGAIVACRAPVPPERSPPDDRPPVGRSALTIAMPEGVRSVVLNVPSAPPRSFGRSLPHPLLLLLHGSNGDGRAIEDESGMDSIADRHGVVVAYPDGIQSLLGHATADWNAGECCGYAQRHDVDDVAFLRRVIDELSARLPIDQSRIYVAGFSDGGRMAYRAGCEMSDRIAAIGVVSGSLVTRACHPVRVPALVAIHGAADDEVPIDEPLPDAFSPAGPERAERLSPSLRAWARLAGCGRFVERRAATAVRAGEFEGCDHAPVMLYTIEGGTHRWPDARLTLSADGNASGTLLRFLLRQRAPNPGQVGPLTR
jgi:polyhydroxybutyrate depolymerase